MLALDLQSTQMKAREPTSKDDPDYVPPFKGIHFSGGESNEGNELTLHFEWDSENDDKTSEEGEDEEFETEVRSEAALLVFAQTLAEAQRVALEVEQKKVSKHKQPKHYTGNSLQRKQRWADK
ncbi:hypothetical protein K439DRAFT_1621171 [Ramaria rubella]|nr:hypothetical protein K439DRAFT_1621171 [Ramaria rubella]